VGKPRLTSHAKIISRADERPLAPSHPLRSSTCSLLSSPRGQGFSHPAHDARFQRLQFTLRPAPATLLH
jgi:hypothetical protein